MKPIRLATTKELHDASTIPSITVEKTNPSEMLSHSKKEVVPMASRATPTTRTISKISASHANKITESLPKSHKRAISHIISILSQTSLLECQTISFERYKREIEPHLFQVRYSQHDFDLVLSLYQCGHGEIAYKLQTILAAQWPYSADVKATIVTSLGLLVSQGKPEYAESFLNLLIEKFDEEQYEMFSRSLRLTVSDSDKDDPNVRKIGGLSVDKKSPPIPDSGDSQDIFSTLKNPRRFKYFVANALVKFALELGDPLLAASLLIQFRSDFVYIQTNSIYNCIRGLLVYDPYLNPFLIRAIYNIYCAYPNDRVLFDSEMKRKLTMNGIRYCKNKYPSFANECFNLAVKLKGDPVPIVAVYKMIMLNLQYNNVTQASNIWKAFSSSLGEFDNHDRLTISALLLRLSKDKKYLPVSVAIASSLQPSYYNLEGITEGLLLTCARSKNVELIEKIYPHLEQPFRRSTLTALLKLHLVLDDSSGVEKLLLEINSRKKTGSSTHHNGGLNEVELSSIIEELSNHDTSRAETFLERFSTWPSKLLLRSYAAISNRAIEKKEWATYQKYLDLLLDHDDSRDLSDVCCIENIQLKAECSKLSESTSSFHSVQRLHQSLTGPRRKFYKTRERLVGLHIICDTALKLQTRATSIIQWLVLEYLNLGLAHNDIRQHLQMRHGFRILPPDIQQKWLSSLEPHDQQTNL
ncbi:hypothetical protein AWJ20_102 [Sugiyamaella lignohabitans]|uniref:Uncharacterized protein n=1 Tax=Sugiyamaella lignohabitans TaxID=796027 RepID=A0A161HHW3_9ASCO|nr:uncharacterized protein AWJ20_102 [Sugiyamaella lignohabitans]ANB11877.1 hypothetical protein AWJ20_102 [Sugiyamaella lignohabitans]